MKPLRGGAHVARIRIGFLDYSLYRFRFGQFRGFGFRLNHGCRHGCLRHRRERFRCGCWGSQFRWNVWFRNGRFLRNGHHFGYQAAYFGEHIGETGDFPYDVRPGKRKLRQHVHKRDIHAAVVVKPNGVHGHITVEGVQRIQNIPEGLGYGAMGPARAYFNHAVRKEKDGLLVAIPA
jgi:hypothetical protein